jgi:hypothetical protein
VLGRTIGYRDVPVSPWSEKLLAAGTPAHIVNKARRTTTKQAADL